MGEENPSSVSFCYLQNTYRHEFNFITRGIIKNARTHTYTHTNSQTPPSTKTKHQEHIHKNKIHSNTHKHTHLQIRLIQKKFPIWIVQCCLQLIAHADTWQWVYCSVPSAAHNLEKSALEKLKLAIKISQLLEKINLTKFIQKWNCLTLQ